MFTLWFLAQSGGNTPNPPGGGGGGGGGGFNYIRIAAIVLMVSISVISWLVRVLGKKREEARERIAKRRREEELLRTGRTESGSPASIPIAPVAANVPASHDEARRRLQEIAQRRRAELQQMAQRGETGAAPPASPVAPVRPIAQPSRPFQPRPAAQPRSAFPTPAARPEPPRPKPAPRQEQRKKQKGHANRPAGPVPQQPTLADKLMQGAAAAPTGAYAVVPQPQAAAGPAIPGPVVAPRATRISLDRATSPAGIDALRKALVLSEVLAPPLSMRAERNGSTNSPLM